MGVFSQIADLANDLISVAITLMSRCIVLPKTKNLTYLFSRIRDEKTGRTDFVHFSNRILSMVVEEAINYVPYTEETVRTPTNADYTGYNIDLDHICAVSIVRAGESMEEVCRKLMPGMRIGKILIQRDEETALPTLFYSKLPDNMALQTVLLLDPMLATGGSAICAVSVLKSAGVKEENIIFVNLVSCTDGIAAVQKACPKMMIVTGEIDPILNEKKYIVPGLGDMGDRYFGTAGN
jgi:uracil phosphoribosyltransferase